MPNFADDYVSRDDLARELRCSARTLARYENEPGGLPSLTLAGRRFYRRSAVLEWLASRERQPNPIRTA